MTKCTSSHYTLSLSVYFGNNTVTHSSIIIQQEYKSVRLTSIANPTYRYKLQLTYTSFFTLASSKTRRLSRHQILLVSTSLQHIAVSFLQASSTRNPYLNTFKVQSQLIVHASISISLSGRLHCLSLLLTKIH